MIDDKKLIERICARYKYWEAKAAEYETKGDEVNRDICDGKAIELEYALDMIDEQPKVGEWIHVSEGLPEDFEPVNITYINRDPESYYSNIKDVPFTATAVYYNGWYWWSSTVEDMLKEYGDMWNSNRIDEGIEVTAWQPLPEPYRGESDDSTV